MRYWSTRGSAKDSSFEKALFSGYTEDGGLFVPQSVPKLSPETIKKWIEDKPPYPQIVYEIARLFISQDEIPDSDLQECIAKAYGNEKFAVKDIIGVKECEIDSNKFKVAELYHGYTASFKDYALSLVGQLMAYFQQKRKQNVVVLVATSGDTGSAAIRAVEGLDGVDIIVLYPEGRISPVQELQLNSSTAKNVHVFSVQGASDELDEPIKGCFPGDRVCSINSINWARIMVQAAHYAYLYSQEGNPISIFVPTGAAGNLVSGVLAHLMGIPVKLFPSTNVNDNVHAFLNKGELVLGGTTIHTISNAMDIRYPYNVERIIHFLSNCNHEVTANYMKQAEEKDGGNGVKIEGRLMDKIREIIPTSRVCQDDEGYETIKKCWDANQYMICPHTATAVKHLLHVNGDIKNNDKSIVISTASPHKFPEVSEKAGIPLKEWDGDKLIRKLKDGPQVMPNKSMRTENRKEWLQLLKGKIAEIHEKYSAK